MHNAEILRRAGVTPELRDGGSSWPPARSSRPTAPGLDLRRHYGLHQSPAIRARGLIFCSGMVAVHPETGEREHGTVSSETRRIFGNLDLLLRAAGSSLDRLVQIHAMLFDRIEYDVLNRAVSRVRAERTARHRTVWSCRIESGFKVQLDAVAGGMTMSRELIHAEEPESERAADLQSAVCGRGEG